MTKPLGRVLEDGMRHAFTRSLMTWMALLAVATGIFWLSCTQKAPLDPGDNSSGDVALLSSMTASPTQILSGGMQAEIRVRLIDTEGNGLAGETVLFSTTLGSVAGSAETDAQGWAQAVLTSGDLSGEAAVTARFGTAVSSAVTLNIVSASESRISIAVGRPSLLASGMDTTAVTVTVLGDSAQPVSGANVIFTRTLGSLSTSAITDGSGKAKALLTSIASMRDTSTLITAQYDTLSISATAVFRGVTLETSANPTALLADGESTAGITATLKETTSHIAIGEGALTFSTDLGLIPNSARTDASGVAFVELTSAPEIGTAHVVTRYGALLTDTVAVAFTAESPSSYVLQPLNVAEPRLIANGVDQTTVSTRVIDDQDKPVSGVTVYFSLPAGMGSLAAQGITDAAGNVNVTLIAPALEHTASATVTAALGVQTQTASVAYDGVNMQISALPDSILSDGISQSVVRVVLKRDISNEAIADASVRFGVNHGTIAAEAQTNAAGVATVQLTSVQSNTPVTAVVTARYGLIPEKPDTVVYTTQAPTQYVLGSTLSVSRPTLLGNGVDQSLVSATVFDDSGVPVAGVEVAFTASLGSIDLTAVTDQAGQATATYTAMASTGDATTQITATLNQRSAQTHIDIEGLTLDLQANPKSIIANGQSSSVVTATVKKTETHVAVSQAVIVFGTTLGSIPNQARTDASGVARVDLTSSTQNDEAIVTARYGTLEAEPDTVVFEASTPQNLQVTTTPPVLVADGQSQAEIKATVTDANSNPVPDGTEVTFELISGSGSLERQKSTSNGIAVSQLTAGTSPGTAQIRVTVAGVAPVTVQVEYQVGQANQVLLTVNTDRIAADGQENATVTARILDAQGTPIEGSTVFFATTIGDVTPSSQSDANGYATAQFSSGEVGTAFITASVNLAEGGSVSGSTTVVAVPGDPNSIVLKFTPTAIGVRETGQNQTSIIEAEVRDARNNPVSDGTEVTFEIVHGPGGGEFLSPGAADMPIPTVGGIARASLSSGTVSGNVRVEARVTAPQGQIIAKASEILVHAGPPYMEDSAVPASTHLTIAAEQLNIWNTLGTTKISIAVFDRYHNPVQEGTAVYLTTSGGGVSTHTAYTDNQGKAQVTLTGANPQPSIHKYYYGDLVQDPNLGAVLPGPVYFPDLGEYLLPNFDADVNAQDRNNLLNGIVPNSMEDSLFVTDTPRYNNGDALYQNLENDGLARIIAYTEGHDLANNSVRAWDQITVVYSGHVGYDDDTEVTLHNDSLHVGQSRTFVFRLMDGNGNPIESNSKITASLTGEVDAKLAWTEFETESGWGKSYYKLTISNNVNPTDTDAKVGYTQIRIGWENDHQAGYAVTRAGVVITGN